MTKTDRRPRFSANRQGSGAIRRMLAQASDLMDPLATSERPDKETIT